MSRDIKSKGQPELPVDGRWQNQHVFAAWDSVISKFEDRLSGSAPKVVWFSSSSVRGRLAQIVSSRCYLSFARICVQRLKSGQNPIPPDDEPLRLEGLTFYGDGRVRVTAPVLGRMLLQFASQWLRASLDVLRGVAGRNADPAALAFGIDASLTHRDGSDARFVEFCRSGPIRPLADAPRILIQEYAIKGCVSDPSVVYDSRIVDRLIQESALSLPARVRQLVEHIASLPRFLLSVTRFPLVSLLAADVAYAAAIRALDRAGLITDVVITNSAYHFQPLWMRDLDTRSFRVHKVHYSQHTKPLIYASEPIETPHPAFRLIEVDEHWVWTEGHREYLEGLGHAGTAHVVGPILFYLPDAPTCPENDDISVAVFDITPLEVEVLEAKSGFIDYFYRADNMLRFIEEIIEACEEVGDRLGSRIRVFLKHKRVHGEGHDMRYVSRIQHLVEEQRLETLPHDTDLFALLSKCSLSISIPFTSVPYVSSSLKKSGLYFDPTRELLPSFERDPFVGHASGKEELLKAIEGAVSFDLSESETSTGA